MRVLTNIWHRCSYALPPWTSFERISITCIQFMLMCKNNHVPTQA